VAVVFAAVVLPVTVLASWRAGSRPTTTEGETASAAAEAAPEPGWIPAAPSDRWKCIVIHHSATEVGGADRFDRAHRGKGWDELGYHFVIGNGSDTGDGRVEVGSRWASQKHGAHCKSPGDFFNDHGIGICLVGNFDRHPPSPNQMRSLETLVRHLCRTYGIPPARLYVHGGVTGKTRCPGEQFDLAPVRAAVSR
jgi:hypothetical protein